MWQARAEAAGSPVLAIPTLEVLHNLDPNDVRAALLLADTYMRAGEPKKAMALLRKQLKTGHKPIRLKKFSGTSTNRKSKY